MRSHVKSWHKPARMESVVHRLVESHFIVSCPFTGRSELESTSHVINKSRAHFRYVQAHMSVISTSSVVVKYTLPNAVRGSSSPNSH
jgi:hypothetical protein